MRVDLHLHSLLSKSNGDSIKFDSYFECFKILKRVKIEMCAFTDHNVFNAEHFVENKDVASKFGISLLPGAELNVVRKNNDIAHVLVLFDDDLSLEEYKKIQKIISTEGGKRSIRIENLDKVFAEFETIKIPHVGKGDYATHNDLQSLEHQAIEVPNENHSNYKAYRKNDEGNKTKKSIVAFSDTHHWNHYPEIGKVYTSLPEVKNFKELKEVLLTTQDYRKEY